VFSLHLLLTNLLTDINQSLCVFLYGIYVISQYIHIISIPTAADVVFLDLPNGIFKGEVEKQWQYSISLF
jgi:hypothetical protein